MGVGISRNPFQSKSYARQSNDDDERLFDHDGSPADRVIFAQKHPRPCARQPSMLETLTKFRKAINLARTMSETCRHYGGESDWSGSEMVRPEQFR
jgi:hypothetical protein